MATQPQTLGRPAEQLATGPRHVAIIMDGNGRWAGARGLERLEGHRAGTENIRTIIEGCVEQGIEILTLYAFSTENWRRPASEVNGLFEILGAVIEKETEDLHRNGVRLRHIGRLEGLPPTLQDRVKYAVELTRRILSLLGKPEGLIRHVQDRPGHDRRYSLDTSKLTALGWTPRVPFDSGLAQTVAWYRENEWWWRPIKHQDAEFKDYYQAQYGGRQG